MHKVFFAISGLSLSVFFSCTKPTKDDVAIGPQKTSPQAGDLTQNGSLTSTSWIGTCEGSSQGELALEIAGKNWTVSKGSSKAIEGDNYAASSNVVNFFDAFSSTAQMVCNVTSGSRTINGITGTNHLKCSGSQVKSHELGCSTIEFIPSIPGNEPSQLWHIGTWTGSCGSSDVKVKFIITEDLLKASLSSSAQTTRLFYPPNKMSRIGTDNLSFQVSANDSMFRVTEGAFVTPGSSGGSVGDVGFNCQKRGNTSMSCAVSVYSGATPQQGATLQETCSEITFVK